MKITDIIQEAPIADIHHAGDFSRNSSFRDPRDRVLVSHPKALDALRRKFSGTSHEFVFFFVNTPEAGRRSEIGEVTIDWLSKNLPKFCQQFVQTKIPEDAITVIFTNNNGAERVNMTAWVIAHRIGHVLARGNNVFSRDNTASRIIRDIYDAIVGTSASILSRGYAIRTFSDVTGDKDIRGRDYTWRDGEQIRRTARGRQLMLRSFWYEIGTFRSARQRNLRDYFEFYYEMFAQYLIQGGIKFNHLPEKFVVSHSYGRPSYAALRPDQKEDCQEELGTLARTLDHYFNDLFSWAAGRIFVM